MNCLTSIHEAQVYVGTYHKYNNGDLSGAWLSLDEYGSAEEFYKACRELHSDEEDPELMFQDWECIPDGLIGECWISEKFFELADKIGSLWNVDAFDAYLEEFCYSLEDEDIDMLISKFEAAYVGEYDSEEDFAERLVAECYNLPEIALRYFDYSSFAKDLFIDGYRYYGGYVFHD